MDAGFNITALEMFNLDNNNSEDFLEIYKGVVAEYKGMVEEFSSGPCVALEISGSGLQDDVHGQFREFVGPHDSEIARALRPRSVRAMFGANKVQNGIHCTDLPEDAPLEVQFFFEILDK